ncbi:MAG: hypothetical protein JKY37_34400 [Nannocystaceae bacterium]|nr:hypothetical protein [Nannocystaceae bacterium]
MSATGDGADADDTGEEGATSQNTTDAGETGSDSSTDSDSDTGDVEMPGDAYDCSPNTTVFDNELTVGNGGLGSIRQALDQASQQGWLDVKITVAAGHDEGTLEGSLGIFTNALVVSETPYGAHIDAINLSGGDVAQYVTFEGFDFGEASGIVIKMDGGQTTDQNVHHVTFRNNVIHDSGANDVVKINAGSNHITFERNILYAHSDDVMDLNSVQNVYVHDNIFFDIDGERSLLVIKDSTPIGSPDFYKSTRYAYVRRNVFLNWQGAGNSMMLYLGEDNDRDEYAVQVAVVENNLFVGNGDLTSGFAAPIGLRGVRDITIRNNTFNGAFANGRSWAFLAWAITDPQLLRTEDLYIYNNAWVANDGVGTARFSKSDSDLVGDFLLDHNLYWNGGLPIPQDDQGVINYTADAAALLMDPSLPDVPDQIPLPTWDAQAGAFGDGSSTICEAFERLVINYGQPAQGSAVIDGGVANVAQAAGDESTTNDVTDDIRGNARRGTPDVGSVELD